MTKIYGIIGHPVKNSLSPVMHNAAFKAGKIDAEYKIFDLDPNDPEALANFCYDSELNQIEGFGVTTPYKEAVLDYLDFYDPLSKKLGVLNTVKNEESNLNGYNTEATGALQALQEKIKISRKKALVLGAGGTARAIIYGLQEFGAEVYVWNRTLATARNVAQEFEVDLVDFRDIEKMEFDIIINATPVGSAPNLEESLLRAEQIKSSAVVMDLVANPLGTQFLKEARKAGAQVISGERMLLHEASGQFEIWFNKPAPFEVMEKALYKEIKLRSK